MPTLQLYDYLLQFPLFLGMSRENLAQVAGHTKFDFQKFSPGQIIVKEADACTCLYFLLSGTLEIETCADDHSYVVTEQASAPYMLQPEAIFGYYQRYTHQFKTLTECSLIAIDKSEVLRLSEEFLVFRLNLLNVFATQTQKLLSQPWRRHPATLSERIARFLVQHSVCPTGPKSFRILMTQLANEVGDSRLNVSHALNQLQHDGILRLHRGRIQVPLLERLRTMLGKVFLLMSVLLLSVSCAETKFVPDGRYLLDEVTLTVDGKHDDVDAGKLKSYVRQENNVRWFSLLKVPLRTYSMSGRDTTKWINKVLRGMGEPPVLFDSLQTVQTCNDLQQMLRNNGYLDGKVELWTRQKDKKLSVFYKLYPGKAYHLGKIDYVIADTVISDALGLSDPANWGLKTGSQFMIDELDRERKRIVMLLNDQGYYRFHKEYIHYEADTLDGNGKVNIRLILDPNKTADGNDTLHVRYKIRNVDYQSGTKNDSDIHLRQGVLKECTYIKKGGYYSGSDLQNTYNHFGRLGAVKYTNISFREVADSAQLDCLLLLQANKPSTVSFQPEGTNTAGDLGAAATLTYQNRNLFRGSEDLTIELRGAYEAIRELEGYRNQNFLEYSIETRLKFPRFIFPFISSDIRRKMNSSSEVALLYDLQNRPEFHRRLWSVSWRYRWQPKNRNYQYLLDLLDLNYVWMPWISETFKALYLTDSSSRNAILRYNYENLFITKIGLGYIYNDGRTALKTNIETSGNVLDLASSVFGARQNSLGQNLVFNIAYAQYVKGDIDFTRIVNLDYSNQLVFHVGLGIAYPYGNSMLLPFEKRYFSGGANSLRGWSVRTIGPGKFKGTDGRIDFINQTGDMKIDLNMEYRTHLFWKLDGALFVDAGNIWTLRNYPDQPGGQFSLQDFPSQLAASYGIGFRFNFDYFVVRFDLGMKAVNPAYETEEDVHYPIIHPKLSRDFAFHFAVGLPF